MTSKSSSFKLLPYVLYQSKRRWWLFMILMIVYLTTGPALMYIHLAGQEKMLMIGTTTASVMQNNVLRSLNLSAYAGLYLLAIGCGVLLGMALFSYLNSAKQSDFYHSMPVKRGQWLISYSLVAIAMHALLLLVTIFCMYVVAQMMVPAALVRESWFVIHFLQINLYFMVSFLLTVLAGQLTGNTLGHLAMTGVIQLSPLMLAGTLYVLCSSQLRTFVSSPLLVDLMYCTLPSSLISYMNRIGNSVAVGSQVPQFYPQPWLSAKMWLVMVLVGIAAAALSLWLYRRRPNERVTETLIYPKITSIVIKSLILFCGALLGGLFFMTIGNDNLIGFFIGFFLFGSLLHIFCEIAFYQNVRTLRKHLPSGIAILALALAVFFIFRMDVFGYDRYVPKDSEIQGIAVSSGVFFGENLNKSSDQVRVFDTEAADIAVVRQLAEDVVAEPGFRDNNENVYMGGDDPNRMGVTSGHPAAYRSSDRTKHRAVVDYQLRNGKVVSRAYGVSEDVLRQTYQRLYDSKAFKESMKSGFFNMEINGATSFQITSQRFESGIPQHLADKRAIDNINTFAVPQEYVAPLVKAFQEDVRERTAEDLKQDTLLRVNVIYAPSTTLHQTQLYEDGVYPSDTRTLAIIEELRQADILNAKDASLNILGNAKLEVMQYEADSAQPGAVVAELNDPVQKKKVLEEDTTGLSGLQEIDERHSLRITFSDGTVIYRYFLADHVPPIHAGV